MAEDLAVRAKFTTFVAHFANFGGGIWRLN